MSANRTGLEVGHYKVLQCADMFKFYFRYEKGHVKAT